MSYTLLAPFYGNFLTTQQHLTTTQRQEKVKVKVRRNTVLPNGVDGTLGGDDRIIIKRRVCLVMMASGHSFLLPDEENKKGVTPWRSGSTQKGWNQMNNKGQ
jgi:hypothetical protein